MHNMTQLQCRAQGFRHGRSYTTWSQTGFGFQIILKRPVRAYSRASE